MDMNKVYYLVICLIAVFVLMWGTIDLVSSGAAYVSLAVMPNKGADANAEEYYQKKIAQDRIFDSVSRILISGIIFIYCRKKAA